MKKIRTNFLQQSILHFEIRKFFSKNMTIITPNLICIVKKMLISLLKYKKLVNYT